MRTRTEQFLPFALLLPSIGFLSLLIVIPMVQALLLAVMAEGGDSPSRTSSGWSPT